MAYNNQNQNQNRPQSAPVACPFEVYKVRQTRTGSVKFNLTLHTASGDITVYGMGVARTRDGVPFLSSPQTAGQNGQWYPNVFIKFEDSMTKAVIDVVNAAIAAQQNQGQQNQGQQNQGQQNQGQQYQGQQYQGQQYQGNSYGR